MFLSHRIQLKPRSRQRQALVKACGVARYTWNWALARWKEIYEETGKSPRANGLRKEWNQCKPAWVYESPKDANQRPFTYLQDAYNRFFKGLARKPQFKRKGQHDSFYISNDKFKTDEKRIRFPVIGWVRMAEVLRFEGKIMSATVSREIDRWFVSIVIEVQRDSVPGNEVIGVDLGVKDAVVLSDGIKHTGPKPLKRSLERLRQLSRQHSRKQRGSSNRRKSAMRLAKLHWRIKNIRKDFLHKTTSMIVSRTKTVIVEDLNVRGMMANHRLARAVGDIGFYEFRRQLDYKCRMNGVDLIVADRFFPSTKLCGRCGTVNEMPLSQREYRCDCGHVEDRDVNAARNLRTLGLRGTNACGHAGSDSDPVGQSETGMVEAGTKPGSVHFHV